MTEEELDDLIKPFLEEDKADLVDFGALADDDPRRWGVIFRHMGRHLKRAELLVENSTRHRDVWEELRHLGEELDTYAELFYDAFAPKQEINTDLLRTLSDRLEEDGSITLDKATVLDIIRTHRQEQSDDSKPPKHPGMYL